MLLQNTSCLHHISDRGSWYSVTTHHTGHAIVNARYEGYTGWSRRKV